MAQFKEKSNVLKPNKPKKISTAITFARRKKIVAFMFVTLNAVNLKGSLVLRLIFVS